MKNLIVCLILLILFINTDYSNDWECGSQGEELQQDITIGAVNHNLVIIYLDFPDGRYNGQLPDETTLNYVQNIDAVALMGYVADPHSNPGGTPTVWNKVPHKYTYLDCWNRIFSENLYIGNSHPDWESHGQYGMPYASGSVPPGLIIPGDTAKGYGSLREYFKETSYGNLNIVPYQVRPNFIDPDDRFKTGIVNNIITINNTKYISPVLLPYTKTSERYRNGTNSNFSNILADARLQTLPQTGFDVNTFLQNPNNRAIFIFAGRSLGNEGGTFTGNAIIIREKLQKNEVIGGWRNVVEGIYPTCHEYGHTLGFGHSVEGNYCLMNTGTDNQNCPPHASMVLKLRAGWVEPDKVIRINTNSAITNFNPSILGNSEGQYRCAVVTIYGKAGYPLNNPNYNHSEYYVIENRRMIKNDPNIKFDKKLVWKTGINTPGNFYGGILIQHYSPYEYLAPTSYDRTHILKSAGRGEIIYPGDGDSRDFYGVATSSGIFTDIEQSRTSSSFNLPTGIQITNITETAGGNMSFNVEYLLGAPPNYDFISYNQNPPNFPLEVSGKVFMHLPCKTMKINAGSVLDFPGIGIGTSSSTGLLGIVSNIIAEGTQQNPIIFQGVGYTSEKAKFKKISLTTRKTEGTVIDKTIFRNCIFRDIDQSSNLPLINISHAGLSAIEDISVILENNSYQGSAAIQRISLTGAPNAAGVPLHVSSISNNSIDIEIYSGGQNQIPTKVTGDIQIQAGYVLNFFATASSKIFFDENAGIENNGLFNANSFSLNNTLIMDKLPTSGKWKGVTSNGGRLDMKFCNINNSVNGIQIQNPSIFTNIDNCTFENNTNQDIDINNFFSETSISITNNTFTGSRVNYNLGIRNGLNVYINNNAFNAVNPVGIYVNNVIDPLIQENNISGSGSGTQGILSYSSGGTYSCNVLQTCSNGMLLNNSSPIIYNNFLSNNVIGLYLTNGSHPVMAPSASEDQDLLNAGFNTFLDNSAEEIYCFNDQKTPQSLPIINNGNNSITDLNGGCLLNTNLSQLNILSAENNYWGITPVAGNFCPQGSVDYEPFLSTIPQPPTNCASLYLSGDNGNLSEESLLLGSANIDYNNGDYSASIEKYKNYITLVNEPLKMYFPLARLFYATSKSGSSFESIESYYAQISQQFSNDTGISSKSLSLSTASDVMQTSYTEAIDEYDYVITTSTNEVEVFYAYVDKMRTVSLMLDSIIGNGGGNGPQGGGNNSGINEIESMINGFMNFNSVRQIVNKESDKSKSGNSTRSNTNDLRTRPQSKERNSTYETRMEKELPVDYSEKLELSQKKLNQAKISLGLDRINLRNRSKLEVSEVVNNVITYKLIEYTLLNHTSSEEPPKNKSKNNTKSNSLPIVFKLHQNYPNPFNPVSTIKFDIPKESRVVIKIYDLIGREVMTLVNELKQPGFYETVFDGKKLASGLYIYRIEAGQFVDVKKMVLIK